MVKTVTLDNGLRLVLENIPYVQSAAMGIWVKTGSVDETPEYAGISHFIEHMMFKGTINRTAKEIASDVDRIGGQINAFTGKETTCYYIKTISSNLLKGAEILVDMLTNSLFKDEEMDKERKVIKEEIKMTLDTPDELAMDEMVELVFGGNPLGNSIIGTNETLDRIKSKDIKEYYSKEYVLDHMVVSVTGNFNETEVIEYFKKQFQSFRTTKENKKVTLVPYEPKTKVIVKDIEQSHICLANKGVKMQAEDYYDLMVLNKIFGGSMSSRLFQNIRESKGLAYTVMSMYSTFSYDGYFNIYAGVSHEKIEEAIKGIKEQLEIVQANGFTQDELEMAKEQIKASYIFGQENVASRMFGIGKNTILCGKVLSQEEVIEKVDRVSIESLQKIIDKVCDFNNYSAVVVTANEIDLEKMMRE